MISRECLLDILLTRKCRFCGKTIKLSENVCPKCAENLSEVSEPRCKYCGAEKARCICKKRRTRYDGITAPYYYEGSAKKALLNLKFGNKEYFARSLAEKMALSVKTDFKDVTLDAIVFVPFSRRQKLVRRYNQSRLLAERLSEYLEIPEYDALVKLFDTKVQHALKGRYRSGNVAGAYDVADVDLIKGKTVLLVDDIKTTGATLNECAKILKIRGAEKVYCVTAALSAGKAVADNKSKKEERQK